MEAERQSARSRITEGILIALIPASAYLWALHYEMGFCNYFYIPYELISLSSTIVLAASSPPFLILSFLFFILVVILLIARIPHRYLSIILVVAGFANITFLLLYSIKRNWVDILVAALLAVAFLIAVFVWPFITLRGQGSSWSRFWFRLPPPTSSDEVSPSSSQFTRRISPYRGLIEIISVLIIIWSFASLSYYVGVSDAERRQEFRVIAQSREIPEEVVVLRIYGDYLITAPIDRSVTPKEIKRTLYIFKIPEMAKTPLTTEKVGPLQVKP